MSGQWGVLDCGHRVRVDAGKREAKCCDAERPVVRFYGPCERAAQATFEIHTAVRCLACGGPCERITAARATERTNATVIRCAAAQCHRQWLVRLEIFDGPASRGRGLDR